MARPYVTILGAVGLVLSLLLLSPAQAAPATPLQQPNWSELTSQQRRVLAPLAKHWDGLESFRRKKWLGIARRYSVMTPEQQQRVSAQMKDWAALSPQDRIGAREKFKKQEKETPEQRAARRGKWAQYQALPEPEKKKFREKAAKRKLPKHADSGVAARPLKNPGAMSLPTQSGAAK
jgi:non-ribosomal peptide synthetase component F